MRVETLGEFGSSQTLPCEASGIPTPNVTWFRNSLPLPLSSSQYSVREDGALLIRTVGIVDTGMFQCVAANAAGEDSQYTWLKVKSKLLSNLIGSDAAQNVIDQIIFFPCLLSLAYFTEVERRIRGVGNKMTRIRQLDLSQIKHRKRYRHGFGCFFFLKKKKPIHSFLSRFF